MEGIDSSGDLRAVINRLSKEYHELKESRSGEHFVKVQQTSMAEGDVDLF